MRQTHIYIHYAISKHYLFVYFLAGADCKHNIVDLLPRIESMIRKRSHHGNHGKGEEKCIGELSTVHRLDKDSTGIILIAR